MNVAASAYACSVTTDTETEKSPLLSSLQAELTAARTECREAKATMLRAGIRAPIVDPDPATLAALRDSARQLERASGRVAALAALILSVI